MQELYECVKKYNRFHVLGHIDIIRRYGSYTDKTIKYCDYSDIIDEIFKLLIYNGKGIEINTSGYRYRLESTMPDFELLKRYRELGGEILTIGSDAHTTQHIAEQFANAHYLADKAGFKYIARFPEGKPEFIKLPIS